MKQNLGVLEDCWFTAKCLQELEEGQMYTTADFVVSPDTGIPGHCNTPVCALSADIKVSSAKLTVNLWLFPPRNELGEPGENTVLQNTKVRCLQRAPGLYLSMQGYKFQ